MLNSQQRLSGASCVSFVWLINEHSSAVWAAEKMECLRFCSYVTILSLSFLDTLPQKRMNYGFCQVWNESTSGPPLKQKCTVRNCEKHMRHTQFFFFFLCVCVCVYLKDICLTSSALQQPELGRKLPFARPTTNIIISNLLCCARANRTDTT